MLDFVPACASPLRTRAPSHTVNGAFVVIVYLLNLLIVFTTDEPMDMLLNMLALEFILQATCRHRPGPTHRD